MKEKIFSGLARAYVSLWWSYVYTSNHGSYRNCFLGINEWTLWEDNTNNFCFIIIFGLDWYFWVPFHDCIVIWSLSISNRLFALKREREFRIDLQPSLSLSIYSYINTYTYTSWQRLRSFTRVVLTHLQFPISSTTTKPLLNKTRFYPHLLPLLLHPIPVSLFLLVFSSFLFLFIPFLIFNVFCLRILLQFIFRLIQISMVIFFLPFSFYYS